MTQMVDGTEYIIKKMTLRPLGVLCGFFVLSITLMLLCPNYSWITALIFASLLFHPSFKLKLAVCCLVGIGLATFVGTSYNTKIDQYATLVGREITASCVVLNNSFPKEFLLSFNDNSYLATSDTYFHSDYMPDIGENANVTLLVKDVVMDSSHFLVAGGLALDCELIWIESTATDSWNYGSLIASRGNLSQGVYQQTPSEQRGLLLSLLFSNKSFVSSETIQIFSKSGTSHLMAVSGFHISVLIFSTYQALKSFKLSQLAQVAIIVPLCFVLFVLAGMSPSIFRGLLMFLFALFASLFKRESDGITLVALSAMVMLVICPALITSYSFLLSHLATLGILLFAKPIIAGLELLVTPYFMKIPKLIKWCFANIAISISAQLLTVPVITFGFGEFSLAGIIINLLAIPICYPILIIGFIGVFFYSCGIFGLANFILTFATAFVWILEQVVTFGSKIPFSTLVIVSYTQLILLVVVMVSVMIFLLVPWKFLTLRKYIFFFLALLPITVFAMSLESYSKTTVISYDYTGTVLVYSKENTAIITNSKGDYNINLDINFCKKYTGKTPDVIIFTDPVTSVKDLEKWEQISGIYYYNTEDNMTQMLMNTGDGFVEYCKFTFGEPIVLWEDIYLNISSKYASEIWIDQIKILKYWGNYGTLSSSDTDTPQQIIVDRYGDMAVFGIDTWVYTNSYSHSIQI